MKVWIQNPFDSLPLEGYRRQRYWMMAEAFAAAGHQVVYWTSDFSHATKTRRVILSDSPRNFELVFLPTKPYYRNVSFARIRSHREYAKEWARQAERRIAAGDVPQLIIVSAPPLATGEIALKLAKSCGAKVVVDVQDAWPETFERIAPRSLRALLHFFLSPLRRKAQLLYRNAFKVSGVCERYRSLVGCADYLKAYLGVELEPIQPKNEAPILRIAYVGNLGKSYDLSTVIAAVNKLNMCRANSVRLEIAGFGGAISEGDAIKYHGMLKEAELNALLAQCDVGIIPMKADSWVGVPNKLAEYARAGLKIVSSLEGEVAELLNKYNCGVTYEAGNVDSLVDAINRVKDLDGARYMCEQEFDAAKIYADYVKAMTI